MKILFYSHSSTLYGAPSSLVNLISGLKGINPEIQIHVILPSSGGMENKLIQEKIPYSVIPHYKWTYDFGLFNKKRKANRGMALLWLYKNVLERYLKNCFSFPAHQRFFKKFKPDIVYVNSSMAPMGCKIAFKNDIPLVWHHRETVNDPITGFYLDDNGRFNKYFQKTNLHLYPSFFLKESYKIYEKSHIIYNQKVIYNGVPDITMLSKNKKEDKPLKFGIIGRINEQKGQKAVMEVFKNIESSSVRHRLELHLFGGGEKGYIDSLKKKYCNSTIFFRGFQNHHTMYGDIHFLIVNAKNESFGRVVAEANAYGVPVIAVKSGALSEIVSENVNGFLYDSDSELLSLILKAPDTYFQSYEIISKSSRKCFSEKFSIEACSEAIYSELRRLINTN